MKFVNIVQAKYQGQVRFALPNRRSVPERALHQLGRGDRVALYTTHCTHGPIASTVPDRLLPLRPVCPDTEEVFRDLTLDISKHGIQKWDPPRPTPPMTSVILAIARSMLDGEIEYRRENFETAFSRLRDAITYEDELPFAEPWGWMLPARHAYAALSLEQGYTEQAARAYAEDLGLYPTPKRAHQHPNNVWALHGYHECLERLGRFAEANIIKQQLKLAEAEADVEITSSCFCRLGVLSNREVDVSGSGKGKTEAVNGVNGFTNGTCCSKSH